MATVSAPSATHYDVAPIMAALYGDGIIGLKAAFSREWAQAMREDLDALFEEALARPGGAVGRGPQRWYVEIHPERLRGFVDLVTHPWIVSVCRAVLGPDFRVVEIGYDVPLPGAMNQPWHRDFPSPPETHEGRRLTSLAFNLTAVDTAEDMGPFEIALGTQYDPGLACPDAMFPPRELYPRYRERAVQKLPQRGDISARSALTIHRGTANRSDEARPVLVVGADAPDATNAAHHDLQISRAYQARLPPAVLDHLTYRLVDTPETVIQHHVIEGLLEPGGY